MISVHAINIEDIAKVVKSDKQLLDKVPPGLPRVDYQRDAGVLFQLNRARCFDDPGTQFVLRALIGIAAGYPTAIT